MIVAVRAIKLGHEKARLDSGNNWRESTLCLTESSFWSGVTKRGKSLLRTQTSSPVLLRLFSARFDNPSLKSVHDDPKKTSCDSKN